MMTPYYHDEASGIVIYHGDCRDILPTIETGSVDLVLTDPPYFRVKNEWWDRQWNSRTSFLSWLGELADEWRRVLKPNGSIYVFASPDMAWHVEGVIRERFNVLNSARWVKAEGWHNKTEKESLRSFLSPWEGVIVAEQRGDQYEEASKALHKDVYAPLGRYIQTERERAGLTRNEVEVALGFISSSDPTRGTALCYRWEEGSCLPTKETYERIRAVLNCQGSGEYLRREYEDLRREYEDLRREYEDLRRPFALTDRSEWSDIWQFRTVAPYESKHPCEKPLPLMEHIISASTRPGDVVLDCFAGSGSALIAARTLGRRAIGVEVMRQWCDRSIGRLQQSVMKLQEVA
jgi:adenine-specific DNA-methyltransferase